MLNLGALRVSESVKREVTIVNRSAIPLTLSVSLVTTSHQLQEDSSVLTVDTVDSKTLLPKNEITLKARNGAGKVLVSFTPTVRIAHFQEEVSWEEITLRIILSAHVLCAGYTGEFGDVSATLHGNWVLSRTRDPTGHGTHTVWHRLPRQSDFSSHSHHQQWRHWSKVVLLHMLSAYHTFFFLCLSAVSSGSRQSLLQISQSHLQKATSLREWRCV